LIIDPDRVLAATIAVKRFQPIGGGPQVASARA